VRLGCIRYINVFPITLGLELGEVPFEGELVWGHPTHLNRLTRHEQLDATAVSSIEYESCYSSYRLVEGIGLYSPGAVQSVKLFSQVPIEELSGLTVGVTPASATSRTLLKILLPKVNLVDLSSELPQSAVLLIGDQALTAPPAPYELDLGQAWKEKTGLPMVWACWLARRSLGTQIEELLERSRAWGQAHPERVLAEAQTRTGLPEATLKRYFEGLRFELGPEQMDSLKLFYQLAKETRVWSA
jgi:chorismate dehydratase